MAIADEIRRIKMRKSAELRAREARAAQRQAKRFEGQLQNNRAPGSMFDPGFKAQLDRKAREARERQGEKPRPDLEQAIATAREKGHLPPAHEGKTSYVPTVEEILGDEALPKPGPVSENTEELPSADDVLNGTPVDGSAFTAEELAEINRLNPAQKPVAPKQQIPHHRRDRHRRR